jgi:hypothetical protein
VTTVNPVRYFLAGKDFLDDPENMGWLDPEERLDKRLIIYPLPMP